jgi:hypothetical protein
MWGISAALHEFTLRLRLHLRHVRRFYEFALLRISGVKFVIFQIVCREIVSRVGMSALRIFEISGCIEGDGCEKFAVAECSERAFSG